MPYLYKRCDDRNRPSRNWWATVKVYGKTIDRSTRCPRRRDAWRVALHWQTLLALGRWGLAVSGKKLSDLVTLYERELARRGSSVMHVRQTVRSLRAHLPLGKVAESVKPEELQEILDEIKGARARTYAHDAARAFYKWAVKHEHVSRSPMDRVTRGVSTAVWGKRRALTIEEFRALLRVVPEDRAIAYVLMVRTGFRASESDRLVWPMIDLAKRAIHIPKGWAKNKLPVTLPFAKDLAAWLERARTKGEERVVTVPNVRTFYRDLAKAGVARVTSDGRLDLHALRVTFVTWIGEGGADLVDSQKFGRLSSPELVSNVYTQLGLDRARAKMDAFAPGDFSPPKGPPIEKEQPGEGGEEGLNPVAA
jgi:site-specific recombinase XerC